MILIDDMAGLMREQPFLAVESAAVARERAVGADDAMARDDDSDGVPTVGGPDGARAPGRPMRRGKLGIADGRSVGNRQQSLPDLISERVCRSNEAADRRSAARLRNTRRTASRTSKSSLVIPPPVRLRARGGLTLAAGPC